MAVVGYIPFSPDAPGDEAAWVEAAFGCRIRFPDSAPDLNRAAALEPRALDALARSTAPLLDAPWVVAEGPAGFVWAAALRRLGFAGGVTILPYLNPRRWWDVAAAAVYRRWADPRDRVLLGSTPSARIYRRLGIPARVGEPYGFDDRRFRPRPDARRALRRLSIPPGRLLLFAGRAEADKDLYALLRVALKARILFPDLEVALASHVVDEAYVATLRRELGPGSGVHLVESPEPELLAELYAAADCFATAATSHFETFGRAPAEALGSGCPAVAPRYDGFAEVLDQPGGRLVDVLVDDAGPRVDEAALLRGVYDALSDPTPPPRAAIAAAAHRRYGRSRTLALLAHVAAPEPGPAAPVDLEPAALELPEAWRGPLAELAELPRRRALDRVLAGDGTDDLEERAPELVEAVRRSLCQVEAAPHTAIGAVG